MHELFFCVKELLEKVYGTLKLASRKIRRNWLRGKSLLMAARKDDSLDDKYDSSL